MRGGVHVPALPQRRRRLVDVTDGVPVTRVGRPQQAREGGVGAVAPRERLEHVLYADEADRQPPARADVRREAGLEGRGPAGGEGADPQRRRHAHLAPAAVRLRGGVPEAAVLAGARAGAGATGAAGTAGVNAGVHADADGVKLVGEVGVLRLPHAGVSAFPRGAREVDL